MQMVVFRNHQIAVDLLNDVRIKCFRRHLVTLAQRIQSHGIEIETMMLTPNEYVAEPIQWERLKCHEIATLWDGFRLRR